MVHQKSLISELEDAVRRGSKDKRVDTLRRITDLFLAQSERLNEEQIQVFDQVLGHLLTRMESTALVELSERLAPINNAPVKTVRTLAHDDEIAIAGPVLSLSDRLTTPDLIEIVGAKSQAHLLAICKRSSLSEALTDALVARGDRDVIGRLAENEGARISEQAYERLVAQSQGDETLLEKLGLRLDIPYGIFLRLLERVSEAVRTRLMAFAKDRRHDIKELLAGISDDVIEREDDTGSLDFPAAQKLIDRMQQNGELDEVALLQLAKDRQYAATVCALAALCSAPTAMLEQMLKEGRNESLLVPCKAAGLSWLSLRALLQDDLIGKVTPDEEVRTLKSDYTKLSQSTARKLLDFWCEHHAPQAS